jgi:hypothetical protein
LLLACLIAKNNLQNHHHYFPNLLTYKINTIFLEEIFTLLLISPCGFDNSFLLRRHTSALASVSLCHIDDDNTAKVDECLALIVVMWLVMG